AALKQPLLVCLDDMQWSDAGTAAALRTLHARLAALPIAWLIAFRPDQLSLQVARAFELLEREGAEKLVLRPLDDAAVAQVALDVMRAEPDEALLELLGRAHGSPFWLMELLSGLREEQLVRVQSGHAELLDGHLPGRVRDSIQERFRGMSKPARETAIVAASLGRKFAFSDLATMLDQPPSGLLSPVGELISFGVLVESGDQLAFRHDIIRDAVRASAPASARRALDRQAVEVLLAAGASPVEVATQLAESADPGDEVAITTLFKAAEALARSDPGAAADMSRRGLELAPRSHPLRGPLVAQTALLLHEAARVDEATAFADTYLREALLPVHEAEIRLSIAGMFAISPDVRVDAGRKALALPDLPRTLRARHLASLVHNLLVGGRVEPARRLLPEATRAAGSSDDAIATFMLNLAEGGLEVADGRLGRALQLTEAAARSGSARHDYARERLTQEWRGETLMLLDRVQESLDLTADGIAEAQRDLQSWALHIFETWRGRQLFQLGRLPDAAAMLEGQLTAEHDERHDSILDVAGVVALGRVGLHTGDARLQRITVARAKTMLGQSPPPSFRRQAAWLLALHAMAGGDAAGARTWLYASDVGDHRPILPLFPLDATDDAPLVRIAIAADDHELAESGVAAATRRSELNPGVHTIAATAAHARGLAFADEQELALAAELFADGPRPLALASALEDLGAVRIKRGAATEGIDLLGRALTIYTRAGAAWDAGRVRGRLREQGVRRRLITPDRPETGWAAMTDSELAVAKLIAQGLTNRQAAEQLFLSPHTVSSHLRRVFTKLDINSRIELTRLADGRRD
ncbi:MAG TPA: LuxR C-terminal-related transcriptional regulator, partial [Solirubrobacteraceae bacterium]